jgi:hypothetical protein
MDEEAVALFVARLEANQASNDAMPLSNTPSLFVKRLQKQK